MDGVSGLDDVLKNLNDQIGGIKNRSFTGLLEAGLKIEAASNERTPSEYGNLRGSSYTRKSQSGNIAVEVGYTANYAAAVHENLGQKLKGQPRPSGLGNYWDPRGEPKFLERTLQLNQKAIVDIVLHHAKVGER